MLGGTLAALLLFSAVYFWRQGQINELTETKTVLVTSNRKIEQKLAAGDKELIQAGKIGEWVDRDIEWLDEIVRLQAILPGTDRFFVDNIQFSTVQVNGTGIIKLEGFAKTTHDIEDVGRVLAEAGYGVKPYTPLQSSANAAPEYAFKVVLELSLPEVKHEQAS